LAAACSSTGSPARIVRPQAGAAGRDQRVLNWVFFLSMLALIVSGGLLYFGIYAGHDAVMVHWYATWVTMAFAGLHILTHYAIARGVAIACGLFAPSACRRPPPRLDAVEC